MKMGGFLHYPVIVNNDYGMFSLAHHYKFQPALWALRHGTFFPYKVTGGRGTYFPYNVTGDWWT